MAITPNEELKTRKNNLIKLHYQEMQDMSNYYHIRTKRYLTDWKIGGRLSSVQSSNLANCEHLRWNAKMELLGFVSSIYDDTNKPLRSIKDLQRRIHSCLVDCQTLKEGPDIHTIKYDRIVVTVSFMPEFDD